MDFCNQNNNNIYDQINDDHLLAYFIDQICNNNNNNPNDWNNFNNPDNSSNFNPYPDYDCNNNFNKIKILHTKNTKNAMTCGLLPLVPFSFQTPKLGTPIRIMIEAAILERRNRPQQEPLIVMLYDSRTGIVAFRLRIALSSGYYSGNQFYDQLFNDQKQQEDQIPVMGRSAFDPSMGWTAEQRDLVCHNFPFPNHRFRLELNVGESEIIAKIDRIVAFRFRIGGVGVDHPYLSIRRSINTFEMFGDVHVSSIEFKP